MNSNPDQPLSILEIGDETVSAPEEASKSRGLRGLYERLNSRVQSFSSIPLKDKVGFFQLLAIMLGAGVPLIKSLYVLAAQVNHARLRHVIATMAQKVEGGKTFSSAMDDFHGVFDDTQIGMVRAGEISGRLNEILKEIAAQAEKSAAVLAKVKGAMIYPAVIMVMLIGAVAVILAFVVPQLTDLFSQAGSSLPMSTQILIGLSDFVLHGYQLILGALVVIFGGLYVWKRTPGGHYYWDLGLLYVPVMGRLVRNMCLARFTRTLGSLMNSGITIVKSLEIDGDAVGNEIYRRRILLAAEDVSRGIPLAENLTDSRFLFPEMVVSMISVGEQTAEVAPICSKIAEYYEAEVDQMAANLSKLMEPFIMLTMGAVVGGLMMAIMQPIFGLLDVVGNL